MKTLFVVCSKCGEEFDAPAEYFGKTFKCHCGNSVEVPLPKNEISEENAAAGTAKNPKIRVPAEKKSSVPADEDFDEKSISTFGVISQIFGALAFLAALALVLAFVFDVISLVKFCRNGGDFALSILPGFFENVFQIFVVFSALISVSALCKIADVLARNFDE